MGSVRSVYTQPMPRIFRGLIRIASGISRSGLKNGRNFRKSGTVKLKPSIEQSGNVQTISR
jgi:hypothetical protein